MRPFALYVNGVRARDDVSDRSVLATLQRQSAGGRVGIRGTDQAEIARLAVGLIEWDVPVALLPAGREENADCAVVVRCDGAGRDRAALEQNAGTATTRARPRSVSMFTSGSTAAPKLVELPWEHLAVTFDWYVTVYRASAETAIWTTLPVTYNFCFIAGVLLAAHVAAELHLYDAEPSLLTDLTNAKAGNNHVVLANPLIIESLLERETRLTDALVDTGGAPLSTTALRMCRDRVGDTREGYGLTETCSLTHFDSEGNDQSAGTVGRGMPGVVTTIEPTHDDKPQIVLRSPNYTGSLKTGDLGNVDERGRLRVLGRTADVAINGLWPHDTLDQVGDVLGARCASVQHLPDGTVRIRVSDRVSDRAVTQIGDRVAEILGLRPESVIVERAGEQALLHSRKLPRVK